MTKFKSKHPHFEFLRKKWVSRQKNSEEFLSDRHLRHITLGGLGSLVLLNTTPMTGEHNLLSDGQSIGVDSQINVAHSKNALLAAELVDKLPKEMRGLEDSENEIISSLIEKDLGIKVKSEIDGKRLNRTYGMIGGEQHLYRYPGDTLFEHARDASDWAMYGEAGIAPGLGAWGYFASSKAEFTKEDEEKERYYIAVQTFLSPGFSERVKEYRDFYKHRKMLLVNPKSGQAVVTVIADAGPAEWTGKHLGGSPEVMHELGLAGGPRKGAVLYFFIDDSQKEIKLGPVKLSEEVASR